MARHRVRSSVLMRSDLGVGVISFFLFPFSSQLITEQTYSL